MCKKAVKIISLIMIIITIIYFKNISIEVESEPYVQTIYANADTFISQHNKTVNFHALGYLEVGKGFYGHLRHALINFTILGIKGLPRNIEIIKAELYITRYKLQDFLYKGYVEIAVCRVTSLWDYATVNWIYRTYTERWKNMGGDYSKPYAKYKVYSYYQPKKTMVFDITQMVKEWYNDPKKYPNYGLIITCVSGKGLIYFYSSNMRAIEIQEKPHIKVTYIYKIKITPPSSTIIIGTGNTKTIDIQVSGYCPYTVNLELKDYPSGITYNFTPPSGHTTFISKLSIMASPKMSTGTYTIKIHAYGRGIECEKELILKIVPGGDFSLSLNPSHIIVSQGGKNSSMIRASISGIFSSQITLSVEDVPPGFIVTINPQIISQYTSSSITVSVNSTVSPGLYNIVIKGTGGGKTHTIILKVEVKPIPFNFDIQVSPQNIDVKSGEKVNINISTILLAGIPQQLSFSLSGLPSNTNYIFNPQSIYPPGLVVLTIDTSNLDGTYSVTITASGGGVTRKATVLLKISGFDFSISVNPKNIEIFQGESKTITVTVTKIRGIAKPVTLSLLNLPTGASYNFNPSVLTPPGTSILTINAGSAKGTYVLIIKGSGGGITKTVPLTVNFKERKCIIATVTYGSEVSNEVNLLRRFRDNIVLSTYAGQRFYIAFNIFYYSWSPYIAQIIHENSWLKLPMKILLYPLIISLLIATNIVQPIIALNREIAVYVAGTIISSMLGII
ncbi:MAG TPA: DNRLRE domain-containing protein, partial [Thermoprotei archaeon]|nr:DNRLRE domain-containing protein [Thermoprotei archaeon]